MSALNACSLLNPFSLPSTQRFAGWQVLSGLFFSACALKLQGPPCCGICWRLLRVLHP